MPIRLLIIPKHCQPRRYSSVRSSHKVGLL